MPTESVGESDIRTLRQTRREERAIGELADRQYGVVSRDQLLRLGFEAGAIGRRIRAGWLRPLHPGIYAVGHRVLPKQGWWRAAVLASGADALLSHRTAAALWGLRGYSGGQIHVTVPHKSTSTKRIRRHFSHVPSDEREVEEGMPVTSVNRTIFDLASTEDLDALVAMIKEAEFLRRYDRLTLWDLLERYPGKRGSRKVQLALQRITEEPTGRKRSKLEERFAPFLRRHNLPLPRFNDWIDLPPIKRSRGSGVQAVSGRLPLAEPPPDRRAGRLAGALHPLCLPGRSRPRPSTPRRRLLGHPPHLEPAGLRTGGDRL